MLSLRGWCDIFLNVPALIEDKSDDTKDSFYGKLERLFCQFSVYHMKNLLGEWKAKCKEGERERERWYFQRDKREREFTWI